MITTTAVKNFAASACGNKKQFLDEAQAKKAAGRTMKKFGGKMRPYRCGYCDLWHLTSGKASADMRHDFRLLHRAAKAQRGGQ